MSNYSFDFNYNYIWLKTLTDIEYLWLEYLYIHEDELHLIVQHYHWVHYCYMYFIYIYMSSFLYKYWKLCPWNKWVISGVIWVISLKCYAYCCILLCICCSLIMDASLICTELATCMMMGGMQFSIVIWIAVHAIVFLMQYILVYYLIYDYFWLLNVKRMSFG